MLVGRDSWDIWLLVCHITSHDQRDMCLGKWEPITLNHYPTKFAAYKPCWSRDETFLNCHVTSRDHKVKGHISLLVRGPRPKSPLHQASDLQVLWKRKYISVLSRDITWLHDEIEIWLGMWKPLTLSYYCVKLDAYKPCGSADLTFLLCHEVLRDHMLIGTSDFLKKSFFSL